MMYHIQKLVDLFSIINQCALSAYLELKSWAWHEPMCVMQVAPVIRNVYERAVRNCPWVGSLWTKYLLALERISASETEHAAVRATSCVSLNMMFHVVVHVCNSEVHHMVQSMCCSGCDSFCWTLSQYILFLLSAQSLLVLQFCSILGCTKALDSFLGWCCIKDVVCYCALNFMRSLCSNS